MNLASRLAPILCIIIGLSSASAFAAEAAVGPSSIALPPKFQLSAGDQVKIEVFGNQDLTTTVNVADDGNIRIPLAGNVPVAGQPVAEAARRIEEALKEGQYLVNPQVTVTIVQSLSKRVTVMGEVGNPGRYPVDANSTVFDIIAVAGGITEKGSDRVYILRNDDTGSVRRIPVDMRRYAASKDSGPGAMSTLQGGDSIVVPKGTYYISGQVVSPGEYRIEGDMMLFEAVARAGGVTQMGSASRVEVRRRGPDDKVFQVKTSKDLRIEPGDVIRIKERIF